MMTQWDITVLCNAVINAKQHLYSFVVFRHQERM